MTDIKTYCSNTPMSDRKKEVFRLVCNADVEGRWITAAEIADDLGKKESAVSTMLQRIKKLGLLSTSSKGWRVSKEGRKERIYGWRRGHE